MPLLMRDLLVLYATHGDATALAPVRSYRYFLEWAAQQDHSASIQAWTQALAGVDEPTLLTRADSGHEITALSGEYVFELGEQTTGRLTALAVELGVTVNTVLQVAWGVLLGRWTGHEDVLFGTTVSGRPPQLSGVESMVGLFINTVPVRVRFDESETARELLQRCRANRPICWTITMWVWPKSSRRPVWADCSTPWWCSSPIRSTPTASGVRPPISTVWPSPISTPTDATHYPLTLIVQLDSIAGESPAQNRQNLRIRAGYLRDLFEESTVRRIADRLVRVFEAIAADPDRAFGDIDLLESGERETTVSRWNATDFDVTAALAERGVATADLAAMFAEQVVRTPDVARADLRGDNSVVRRVRRPGEFAGALADRTRCAARTRWSRWACAARWICWWVCTR